MKYVDINRRLHPVYVHSQARRAKKCLDLTFIFCFMQNDESLLHQLADTDIQSLSRQVAEFCK